MVKLDKVEAKILANKEKYAPQGFDENDEDEPWVTMHNCQYPLAVREHLDSGVLERVILKLRGTKSKKGQLMWMSTEERKEPEEWEDSATTSEDTTCASSQPVLWSSAASFQFGS